MVDILAVGTGAVNAYRQALSTTSNNIANVNTPGYSRRELILGESSPVERGAFTFGSGAQARAISRAYDEFIERSLRDATSGFEKNNPIVEYASRVVDAVASENASLAGAIDEFFNNAQMLTTDPSSKTLRSEFLSSASLVEARFNDLSVQVARITDEASAAFKNSIDDFNALAEQLLAVNKKLAGKPELSDQSPGLLDERDAILRSMSELAEIGVIELSNGQVAVNFGGAGRGSLVVTPTQFTRVGMIPEASSLTDIGALVLDPGGDNTPAVTGFGGFLGGMLSVSNEVLSPMISGLDHLAVTFTDEINSVHRGGLDLNGEFGGDLFSAPLSFSASTNTAIGDLTVQARVLDSGEAKSETYQLMYRAHSNSWDITNLHTNDYLGQIPHQGESQFMGLELSLKGSPVNGDTVYLTPESRPARTFNLLIDDVDRVAVAASMKSAPATSNSSLIDSYISVIDRDSGFVNGFTVKSETKSSYRQDFSLTAGATKPAFQILKGTVGADLEFNLDSDQHLHLFTKEGVYVAGTRALTAAEANRYIGGDDAFGDGAYSNTYFNKQGTDAYLDTSIQFGVSSEAKVRSVHAVVPESTARVTEEIFEPASLVASSVNPTINETGLTETIIRAGALTFTYENYDPNDLDSGDDGFVPKSFELGELKLNPSERLSAALVAEYFNDQFANEGVTGVSASAINIVRVNNIDMTQSLSINGREVTVNPKGDLQELIGAINEASSVTNVKAIRTSDNDFYLTNTSGFEGQNIEIGVPGTGDTKNALGLASGIFSGTYEIHTSEEALIPDAGPSVTEKIRLTVSDGGAPSDLRRLGFSTDVLIEGPVPDDLAVFVSGLGDFNATVRVAKSDDQQVESFPANSFRVEFTSDTIYTITDLETDTVVSTRFFDSSEPIIYEGVSLSFSAPPKLGDSFNITENAGGIGSNENFLRLIDLGKAPIINGQTFSEAYLDLVGGVGTRNRVAELNRGAMEVMRDQAAANREAAVGVNLDEEAANLIRFQQAYQAAAQVIQLSQRMFDTLLQMR